MPAIVRKLTPCPKKHTRRARIDRKKADTLQKKCDCVGTPNRYNGNTIGALPLQFFETALKLANGAPVEKWVKSKEDIFRQDTAAQELPKRQY